MYAHVTNAAVDQVALPDTWRRADGTTVSGYQFTDPADLAADGWLPVIEDRPELGPGEAHGAATYTVTTDQVIATYPVVAAPAAATGITLADVAAALRDPLANLTPSSASTTVRTAILNQRAALDALLAALETP